MKFSKKPLLITPSLINKIVFLVECPASWKVSAYDSLRKMLKREYTNPSIEAQRGIDFENEVYKEVFTREKVMDPVKQGLFDRIEKGNFQYTASKALIIDDQEYTLYGKLDVFFPKGHFKYKNGHIRDIKTTKKYIVGKYLKTIQHKIYCYCTGVKTFDYDVVEFKEHENGTMEKILHPIEHYEVSSWASLEKELKEEIQKAMGALLGFEELFKLYLEVYTK